MTRWIEFVLLFVVVPTGLYFARHEFGALLIPTLVVVGSACLWMLWRDPSFDRRRLGWRRASPRAVRGALALLAIGVPLFVAAQLVFEPGRWLQFPTQNPWLWLAIMVFYPLLSVWPQELVYRAFLFHRYKRLFPSQTLRCAVSALAFGGAHAFFANWVAIGLTTAGGWLFARTYAKSGSVIAASLEHALWGNALFTIGWGWYFYAGSI